MQTNEKLSCSLESLYWRSSPQILIFKIYTLKLFKSAEVSFIKWLISFVMFCRDIWRTIEINYKEYNILQNVEKHGFLVLIGLRGQTKNGRPFELMCITRNLSVIYQLYANVSSLSLYNLIMCHIVSFDFFPSLER